ncbi:hypothetical protein BB987_02730 [Photorhabdus temperata]|uniref:Uncharacterized protein n=1 Tax=Photorhabdus khanii NC19 TaxID=1004151 RepID=W3V4P1_9GAMM|nr:hypothetical protein PTE_02857 [Photorhabdus khanii NC19]OHV49100.1 hypothetical protein BB987_02730 [Photorhabdus temperata]
MLLGEQIKLGRKQLGGQKRIWQNVRVYPELHCKKLKKEIWAVYEPELPLKSGIIVPLSDLTIPGCIRNASFFIC